jgi:hypothetical protein
MESPRNDNPFAVIARSDSDEAISFLSLETRLPRALRRRALAMTEGLRLPRLPYGRLAMTESWLKDKIATGSHREPVAMIKGWMFPLFRKKILPCFRSE